MTRHSPRSGLTADREELDRFKVQINLTEFAAARGYQIDRRESSRGSAVMRHPGTNDKIVVARRDAEQHWTYFSVRDDADNGTVIDFLQRRGHGSFGEIRKELRSWLGADRPTVPPQDYVPNLASPVKDRVAVQRLFDAARRVQNSAYLNSRGIRPETLVLDRFRDAFREDDRGNVLFPHSDEAGLTGFESKNHRWTAFAAGGTKSLWSSRADGADHRLVMAESAIDALSYHQLQPSPRTRYISTAGTMSPVQLRLIAEEIAVLAPGSVVVAAFDADDAGAKLANVVRSVAGGVEVERHIPPLLKDWNDVLKRKERECIRSLGHTQGRPPKDLDR